MPEVQFDSRWEYKCAARSNITFELTINLGLLGMNASTYTYPNIRAFTLLINTYICTSVQLYEHTFS